VLQHAVTLASRDQRPFASRERVTKQDHHRVAVDRGLGLGGPRPVCRPGGHVQPSAGEGKLTASGRLSTSVRGPSRKPFQTAAHGCPPRTSGRTPGTTFDHRGSRRESAPIETDFAGASRKPPPRPLRRMRGAAHIPGRGRESLRRGVPRRLRLPPAASQLVPARGRRPAGLRHGRHALSQMPELQPARPRNRDRQHDRDPLPALSGRPTTEPAQALGALTAAAHRTARAAPQACPLLARRGCARRRARPARAGRWCG
jgi:hypothetical protein